MSSSLRAAIALVCVTAVTWSPHAAAADDRFSDVPDQSIFHDDIGWLANSAVTRGCNPPANDRFCPDAPVTRGQMAAFLVRALDLDTSRDAFADTRGHLFEADISRLAEAGITRGCNPPSNTRFCPDEAVTRGQMAAFLRRALSLDVGEASFVDLAGSVFTEDIEALAAEGITRGCNPPSNTRFCPDQLVTRAQMAAFLRRGIEGVAGRPSVVLKWDGLNVVDFGDDAEPAIAALVEVLGPADEDTGWIDPWSAFGVCPGDEIRGVRWSHLQTLSVRSSEGIPWAEIPPGEVFMSYFTGLHTAPGSYAPPLTTAQGIQVGDSVADLRAAYGPDLTFDYMEEFDVWRFAVTDGLRGSVTGDTEDDSIQSIEAGVPCGE